jgi:arylsulfatase A-like enzyme
VTSSTRRNFLGPLAAALPFTSNCRQGAPARKHPNVILVLTDDQGYADLACHGNQHLRTPHLDRVHRESVRFTNFHSSPLCSPTRASLMTGRYNYRTGVIDTWVGLAMMRASEVTLAEALGGAGYRTGLFGKWHLGDNYPLRPMDQGFEETLTFTDGMLGAIGDPAPNTYFDPVLLRNGQPEKTSGYCTQVFFDAALRFMEKNREQPFFVYLPTNVPHGPLDVAEADAAPYRAMGLDDATAKVYGMVENLDRHMGRLLRFLETSGLDKDTILIFMTDNGLAGARYNAGLRGQKGSVYNGGIKVPFFLRAPGRLPAGVDVDRIAAHIDVYPTLLDLCGVKKPDAAPVDGVSLRPLLSGNAANWPDRTLFFQQTRPDPQGIDEPRLYTHGAARSQRYKIVMSAADPKELYTKAIGVGETELFDMEKDPGESTNIAPAHPGIVSKMRSDYEAWFRDVTRGLHPPVRNRLGAPEANPTTLTGQDVRGPQALFVAWNHRMAERHRQSEPKGSGYWEVEVMRGGEYEITLRFGAAEDEKSALEAGKARLQVGPVAREQPIVQGARAVTFRLALKPGEARLEAVLSGQRKDGAIVSPCFVDVRWLSGA